jgi:hypothetical protein
LVFKEVNLQGYGKILIQPISIKPKELEDVDPQGNPVTSERVGESAKTVYHNSLGAEISRSQLCKKINLEGEDLILKKFEQTKEVNKEDIEVLEEPGLIYSALERKFYAVTCDNPRLKELILGNAINPPQSLAFAFVAGGGYKIWRAILTSWHGHLLLVCCIGDLSKEMEKYTEETVEIELEITNNIPPEKAKKLLKAMAMN